MKHRIIINYPLMISRDFCKHKVIEETREEKADTIKSNIINKIVSNYKFKFGKLEKYLNHS